MNGFVPAPYDDYAQSANSLFHFVPKLDYLKDILGKQALVPRYCAENIEYLDLEVGGIKFSEVLVLQKCFCDIPLHKLMDPFEVDIAEEVSPPLTEKEIIQLRNRNTHPDYYGQYAIAFSKRWGESKRLQPIQYVNEKSDGAADFKSLFESLWAQKRVPAKFSNDILHRISFMKPLRGVMKRSFEREGGDIISIDIFKNFHDEKEWRYIPGQKVLEKTHIESIIANPTIRSLPDVQRNVNNRLASEDYKTTWLHYEYDDVRYLIVQNLNDRIELIDFILHLPEILFASTEVSLRSKHILISKILVLDEIRKDW